MSVRYFTALLVSSILVGWHSQPIPQPAAHRPVRLAEASAGFIPNLGQWNHASRFVRRGGQMTTFLERAGWIIDLTEAPPSRDDETPVRASAFRMAFVGARDAVEVFGENASSSRCNFFLGDDPTRWRTGVPRYESVLYRGMYEGIDIRVRDDAGYPEYDLLCAAGIDLSQVVVEVTGAERLSIDVDGGLVIGTALGPVRQPRPKTWVRLPDGTREPVECAYRLLSRSRFGFVAPAWSGEHELVIDPGLLWSTYLGGELLDNSFEVAVDEDGVVTHCGTTYSTKFPKTLGAYQTGNSGNRDAFVAQFDPSRTGSAQLLWSTYCGGSGSDSFDHMVVDTNGVVTLVGTGNSADFPTTIGAFQPIAGGFFDAYVTRFDPSKSGAAQLVYSTFVGGAGPDNARRVHVDGGGILTVVGGALAAFPVTVGAYQTKPGGGSSDGFVLRLDLSKSGSSQLIYSSYLGSFGRENLFGVHTDVKGVITVAGSTSGSFPTTSNAYDRTHNGLDDLFICRLDPSKKGAAQLIYGTYIGGNGTESTLGFHLDASGVVTLGGFTTSTNFPITAKAYGPKHKGGNDGFVLRFDPANTKPLRYSTFVGGKKGDEIHDIDVHSGGVVTAIGVTDSADFPTSASGHDRTHNGKLDGFVVRLDPRQSGAAQLDYGTYFGTSAHDGATTVAVDGSGAAIVGGWTQSTSFPTTVGAFDRTANGGNDLFVSRFDMNVPLRADLHSLPLRRAGTQRLTLSAGAVHANRLYWVLGSASGTTPGVGLFGVPIPLNPDSYTDFSIANANTTMLSNTRGKLDATGRATASFNVPAGVPVVAGFTIHHAYVVYDASGVIHMASNGVPLRLR